MQTVDSGNGAEMVNCLENGTNERRFVQIELRKAKMLTKGLESSGRPRNYEKSDCRWKCPTSWPSPARA